MPYAIEHNHGTSTYKVINLQSGHVLAHNTSLEKAEAQVRLLHSLEDKNYNDMEKYNRGRMLLHGKKEKKEFHKRGEKLEKLDPEERQAEIMKKYKQHH